ncbi:hypothetical protein GGP41_009441 [Bipolaris sorokiniana]|uniref:Uncharacterized protein n=1 Tax=Cochliobolus sativus TaxID=45130 RepID=A0A8H5ZAD6_COCSA|nr:hypothetical protein GGP41_009441 [Bipolaris sorokiniana]
MHLARLSLTICNCNTSSHGKANDAERRRLVVPSITRTRQTDVTSNTLRTNSDHPQMAGKPPVCKMTFPPPTFDVFAVQ